MSIRKRGKDTYQIRVYAGVAPDGRDDYIYETVKGSFKEAKEAEVRLRASVVSAGKQFVSSGNPTFSEFAEMWFSLYVQSSVAPTTMRGYRNTLDNVILPFLGKIRMRNITPNHIQAFVNAQTKKEHCYNKTESIKPSTVRSYYRILAVIFNRAVKLEVILRSPCKGISLPVVDRNRVRSLTIPEVRAFLAAAKGSRYSDLFLTAIMTGLRLGELAALKWDDIDFKRNLLSVKAGGSRPGMAKTLSSKRTISIPKALSTRLQTLLLEHRVYQSNKPGWNSERLVFASRKGRHYVHRHLVNDALSKVMEEAGIDIPGFTFHSLRGAHASLLADAGLPIRDIAERLGHTDPALTMRLYIRTDGKSRATSILDAINEGSNQSLEGGDVLQEED